MLSVDDARYLAMDVGLEWDDGDIELLSPLVDAAFVARRAVELTLAAC